ncbi:hypothetical protein N7474_002511 [Penicillium riverlandense]|uniref:uncharacterized protein n=1 Tax=Penicillium riverlandense TaxID=1903569 RepID=UPI00254902BB|nr:uncharacterized protein N7474_002511 [Penicillium riverlandense]KAJ5825373.1 hypothetical protein N7474_002511 [Penicillium riverlandense]
MVSASLPPAAKPNGTIASLDTLDHDILIAAQQKYQFEREKRHRPEGAAQYIDLSSIAGGPARHAEQSNVPHNPLLHQEHHRVLIVGAGFGGLLYAVRLLQTGFCSANEITMIDQAGGFGGTWYWNQYPGLHCDTESYIYMPLLEETGHMPTKKYVPGSELRAHAERIASQWGLTSRAIFHTTVNEMSWDDGNKHWMVSAALIAEGQKPVTLRSDFVIHAMGIFNVPKIPKLPGIESYGGHMFHTSRWDYEYTGGTQENPTMDRLHNKRVGLVGTGATAIQAIPHVAQWAKELFVFQRTPSSVDRRDNKPTDPTWWAENTQTYGPGWQKKRMENFNAFVSNASPLPETNLVNDEWTSFPSFSVLVGGPSGVQPDYLEQMKRVDFARQEYIRKRVDDTVTDKAAADLLKPWYAGWCKRPCFSENFLETFNRPNVTLVDTLGRGVEGMTPEGVLVGGKEIKLDAMIFSTGYTLGDSAEKGIMKVTGRGGKTMQQKWASGPATLHGVITHDFPNLFLSGPCQVGASPNHMYVLDQLASHVAYIISQSAARLKARDAKFTVEPSSETEEGWSMQILINARALAGVADCTPSYYNREGHKLKDHEKMVAAKFAIWGEGVGSYAKRIEDWRSTGKLEGLVFNGEESV